MGAVKRVDQQGCKVSIVYMSGSAFDSRYVQVDLESAVPTGERTQSNFRDKEGEARW
jgi:hypothetical protein